MFSRWIRERSYRNCIKDFEAPSKRGTIADLNVRRDLALMRGQIDQAQRWATAVMQLTAALSSETNPAPVKYALELLGIMSSEVRLPLVGLRDESKTRIALVLAGLCEPHSADIVGRLRRLANDAANKLPSLLQ